MKKIFTILIVILPIISVYKSPIPGVDMGTFLVILLIFFIVLYSKNKLFTPKWLVIMLIYIITSTLISLLVQSTTLNLSVVLRCGKFVFLIVTILILGYNTLFDFKLGIKCLKIVSISAAIYIFIQTIVYRGFGILLPNGFLNYVTYDAYVSLDYTNMAIHFYRPSAFFLEPAHCVQYLSLYLCYSIFGYKRKGILNEWKSAICISVGIILSGSGQGLLILGICWGVWLISIGKNISKKNFMKLLSVLIILMFVICKLLNTQLMKNIFIRLFTDNVNAGGNAIIARLTGYSHFSELSQLFKLIGVGYGNTIDGVYFSSFSYILYCCGILGLIIMIGLLIERLTSPYLFQKIFIIVFFIFCIGANIFVASSICFYFPFIYYKESIVNKVT